MEEHGLRSPEVAPGRDIPGDHLELPSIPVEDVAASLERKAAQWRNVLDRRVMETEEKVRRHSRKAPFRHGPVADAHTHAHTMFCKIFKGILETLRGGPRSAAEPHSSAPIEDEPPSAGLGAGTRQGTQHWPHRSVPKTRLQYVHPSMAQGRF